MASLFSQKALNEQQPDYLNYMLGSIASSSSMNHTRTHITAEAHTLCLPSVSRRMHIFPVRQTHDCWPCDVHCARLCVCHPHPRKHVRTGSCSNENFQKANLTRAGLREVTEMLRFEIN